MTAKMTIRPLLLLLFLILQAFSGFCQKSSILNERRDQVDLNANWQFVKDPKNSAMVPSSGTQWQVVNLPHTWNAKDVLDEVPGYYRGAGWYKKSINTDAKWTGKELFLCFNGANQETDVYINGQNAGRHLGGYTRFLIPISRFLNKSGSGNTIAVKVNNRFNENIAPLTADFTFYGGIYRTVSLVAVDPVHFSDAGLGGSGVYISTPFVSKSKGNVKIHGQLINNSPSIRSLILKTVIYDPQGKVVAQANSALGQVAPNQNISFSKAFPSLLNPVLWSPDDPRLYQISAQIIDSKSGAVLDGIRQQTGLRWFRFDANKGFFLNGRPYKLIGVSRHQDFENLGNAVPDSTQVKDIQMLKKMGGNFLRVAHYPQDQSILDACDRLGILASVEIPIVNEITETKAFADNGKRMLLEMINQNYNHPSIVVWGYMNEILLKMKFKDDEDRQKSYIKNIVNLASALNKAAREADPYRYTMIANHGSTKVYQDAGLTKIPMLVGWNLYNGWYGGKLSEFADNLDKIHKEMPDKPFMVTEYGADADQRIHALAPERFDKSIEYAVQFHQYYLNAIKKRPFVSGAQAWNLADFGAEDREETMPHMNTKGLMTQGRKPKNVFYLYNAYLSHTIPENWYGHP
jgi:beta-galactosidase